MLSQPDAGSAVESPGLDRLVADLSTMLVECPTDAIGVHVGAAVDRAARCLDPDELPPEAASDRAFLEQAGIRSLVGLPLVVGGTPVGWLAFGTARGRHPWSAR